MFAGYWKRPDLTEEFFSDDGWYKTGDVVELYAPPRTLRVIDRKSNVVKLRNGEFVAPDPLENLLVSAVPWVRQAFVWIDGAFAFVAAVLVLDRELFGSWLATNAPELLHDADGHARSWSEWRQDSAVHKVVLAHVAAVGAKAQLRHFEVPRCVVLLDEPFTPENGLLTSNDKLARPQLKQCFGDELRRQCAALELEMLQRTNELHGEIVRILGPAGMPAPAAEHDSSSARRLELISTPLLDLGVDSVSVTRIFALLKEQYGRQPPITMLHERASLADMIAFVQQRPTAEQELAGAARSSVDRDELLRDAALPADYGSVRASMLTRAAVADAVRRARRPSGILLTGATGFAGSYFLAELLSAYNDDNDNGGDGGHEAGAHAATIYCLVRPPRRVRGAEPLDEAQAQGISRRRLQAALRGKQLELSDAELQGRVRVVHGDLAQPLLGLSESEFEELARVVDVIFHNGAWVNGFLPYRILRPSNVYGTAELIRLATTHKTKPLHYVSTIGVYGTMHAAHELMAEHAVPPVEALLHASGYDQSKWVAETMVRAAAAQGLPVTIHRPGLITGHSRTGVCNETDWLCRLLKGCIELGCYLSPTDAYAQAQMVEFCPVDLVVSSVVAIAQQFDWGDTTTAATATADSITFQHLNPEQGFLSYADIMRGVALFSAAHPDTYPASEVDAPQWLHRLQSVPSECALFPVHTMFLSCLPGISYHGKVALAQRVQDFFAAHPEAAQRRSGTARVTSDDVQRMLAFLLNERDEKCG